MSSPRVWNVRDEHPWDAVLVDRTTKWGNRFKIGRDGDRDEVCDAYEEEKLKDPKFIAMVKRELKGKHLVCHCKPRRCHGDWLLKVANS